MLGFKFFWGEGDSWFSGLEQVTKEDPDGGGRSDDVEAARQRMEVGWG